MRRLLPLAVLAVVLAWPATSHGRGLLIPEEKALPPLAMLACSVGYGTCSEPGTTPSRARLASERMSTMSAPSSAAFSASAGSRRSIRADASSSSSASVR